jgi:hypothetical protein
VDFVTKQLVCCTVVSAVPGWQLAVVTKNFAQHAAILRGGTIAFERRALPWKETGLLCVERTGGSGKLAKKIAILSIHFVDFGRLTRLTGRNPKRRFSQMQYLLLIYLPEAQWETLGEPEKQKIYLQYRDLIGDLQKTGNYLGGHELQPTSTATTVRVRNGKKAVTDGPFAETKEQLGGYFLVEAKDLDEAMAIAARIPSATAGSIEVRPVMVNS